jgi:hypothetical protein
MTEITNRPGAEPPRGSLRRVEVGGATDLEIASSLPTVLTGKPRMRHLGREVE